MRKVLLTVLLALVAFVPLASAQNEQYFFNGDNAEKAFTCTKTAAVDVTSAATDVVIARANAPQVIRICSLFVSGDTTATTATLSYGTGTTCGTGNVVLSGGIRFVDETGYFLPAPAGVSLMRVPAGQDFCIAAATGAVTGFVSYAVFQ